MLVLRDGGVGSDLINCVSVPAASKPCSVSKIFLASPGTAAIRPPFWRCISYAAACLQEDRADARLKR